jgi:hypothetical protein
VLAATAQITQDLDLAEEFTQDAYAQTLRSWPAPGTPDRPGAWLTIMLAIAPWSSSDGRRWRGDHCHVGAQCLSVPARRHPGGRPSAADLHLLPPSAVTRCSGCLDPATCLRTVHGRGSSSVLGPGVDDRRADHPRKEEDRRSTNPVPCATSHRLADRLDAVLEVAHLIFTIGHNAPFGEALIHRDLVDSSIALARVLHLLMPTEAETSALLALFLLVEARSETRVDSSGRLLVLSEQDRDR